MTNRDRQVAWTYHDHTKHSYQSVRANPHYLDWANQPSAFKIYPDLSPLALPREVLQTGIAALSAISPKKVPEEGEVTPNLNSLGQILYFSAGITKRRPYPGGEIFFRAASCTGALYEIELYIVCCDLPGLEAGVYHFGVGDFSLRKLRAGDYRKVLAQASGAEPVISHAPVTIICTGTYWRNAWKYGARTYRHFGWDNGTILANLLAICEALRLPARVVCGFVDAEVNQLLDLETEHEVTFSLIPIGYVDGLPPAPPSPIRPLGLGTIPYSDNEVDYPSMRKMHDASSLRSVGEVSEWRACPSMRDSPAPTGTSVPLQPFSKEEMPPDSIEQVILRRGSTRNFTQESITFTQLSEMLFRSTRGIPADFLHPFGTHLNDIYLLVHAVEDLAPGAYVFHSSIGVLECLKQGNFRSDAYYLGLEQKLPAEASVAVFYLSDLQFILERFGNRGYRAVQLEAGILGGKLYLAAYAQRLGASGLTFYDDDVVSFFSPHAQGKNSIFLMAVGRSKKQNQQLVSLGE